MFDLNDFIMRTLKGMIGNYPDFQVQEYALNWYAKGKLSEDDLAEIDALISAPMEPEEMPEEIESKNVLSEIDISEGFEMENNRSESEKETVKPDEESIEVAE